MPKETRTELQCGPGYATANLARHKIMMLYIDTLLIDGCLFDGRRRLLFDRQSTAGFYSVVCRIVANEYRVTSSEFSKQANVLLLMCKSLNTELTTFGSCQEWREEKVLQLFVNSVNNILFEACRMRKITLAAAIVQ